MVSGIDKNSASLEYLEEVTSKLSALVFYTHHTWIDLEQKLLIKYMKLTKLTRPQLDRKIQICINIMKYIQRNNVPASESLTRRYKGLYSCLMESMMFRKLQEKVRRSNKIA